MERKILKLLISLFSVFVFVQALGSELNWKLVTDVPRKIDIAVPPHRYSHTSVNVGEDIYIFGGLSNENVFRGDFWRFSTRESKWERVIDNSNSYEKLTDRLNFCGYNNYIPGARSDSAMISTNNGLIYMYGGFGYAFQCPNGDEDCLEELSEIDDDLEEDQCTFGYLSDIFTFDTNNNEWRIPFSLSQSKAVDENTERGYQASFDVYYRSNFERFKIDQHFSYPSARSNALALYKESTNSIYVFGGRGFHGSLNDLWHFDLTSSKWAALSSPNQEELSPPSMSIPYGYLFNDEIMVFSKNEWSEMYKFSVLSRKWSVIYETQQHHHHHPHRPYDTEEEEEEEIDFQKSFFNRLFQNTQRNVAILGFQEYVYQDSERDTPTHDYGVHFNFLLHEKSRSGKIIWSSSSVHDNKQKSRRNRNNNNNKKKKKEEEKSHLSQSGRHEFLTHPSPRTMSSANMIGEKIYFYGGKMSDIVFGDLWVLDLESIMEEYFVDWKTGQFLKCSSHISHSVLLYDDEDDGERKTKQFDECFCEAGYTGKQCEIFSCHSIPSNNESLVCGGHGKCVSIDVCHCDTSDDDYEYFGKECEYVSVKRYSFRSLLRYSARIFVYMVFGGSVLGVAVGYYFVVWLRKERGYSDEVMMGFLETSHRISDKWDSLKSAYLEDIPVFDVIRNKKKKKKKKSEEIVNLGDDDEEEDDYEEGMSEEEEGEDGDDVGDEKDRVFRDFDSEMGMLVESVKRVMRFQNVENSSYKPQVEEKEEEGEEDEEESEEVSTPKKRRKSPRSRKKKKVKKKKKMKVKKKKEEVGEFEFDDGTESEDEDEDEDYDEKKMN